MMECIDSRLKSDLLIKVIPHLQGCMESDINRYERYTTEMPDGEYARDAKELTAEYKIKQKEVERIQKELSRMVEC